MEKVNINEKLSLFSDLWNPRVVGELNGQHVRPATKRDHKDPDWRRIEEEN
jgi:hypothetical protein